MESLGLSKEQKKMVITLLMGAVLVVLNQTLLSPALPSIMANLNVDATTVQWLTSAYALVEAIIIPLAAWFMGRFSTRVLFVGAMSLFAMGSLVAAIAPAFAFILLGRIMQAMATGVMMAMVISLILLSFPRESRGAAMGIVGLVIGFAPAIGPTVGGLLVDLIGWRALFCVVVVLSVVVILLALRSLENYEGFPRSRFDVISVIFSTLGLAPLLYGLSSFASSDHIEVCIGLIVFGLIFLALFAHRQFSIDEPLLRLEIMKSRRYRTGAVTVMFLQATMIGLGVLMPLYIQNVLGYSATISGLITLPGAVLGALAGLWAGKMFDRHGVRMITILGAIVGFLSGIGMVLYGVSSPVWLVILANVLNGVSLQFLTTPINTWGVNSLDNDLVQHATSVTNTVNQVGGSLGTALIMSFSAVGSSLAVGKEGVDLIFAGYHMSFGVVAVLMTIVLILVVCFVRNRKSDPVPNAGAPAQKKEGSYCVAEVMNSNPLTIPVNATMNEATQVLSDNDASGAILVDDESHVCGFISNSDILRFFSDETSVISGGNGITVVRYLDNEDIRKRVARMSQISALKVATKNVVGIQPNASFEEACNMLAEKRLKQLPVIEDGKLVGTLHRHDLMDFLSDVMKDEVVQDYIAKEAQQAKQTQQQ